MQKPKIVGCKCSCWLGLVFLCDCVLCVHSLPAGSGLVTMVMSDHVTIIIIIEPTYRPSLKGLLARAT